MAEQEYPIVVRFMTPEEESEYWGFSGMARTYLRGKPREILLRRKSSLDRVASTFVHEHGHILFPLRKGRREPRRSIRKLFGELCACYYQLGYPSSNPLTVLERIEDLKDDAIQDWGLSIRQVNKLDRLAKERVGYTGRSVD